MRGTTSDIVEKPRTAKRQLEKENVSRRSKKKKKRVSWGAVDYKRYDD